MIFVTPEIQVHENEVSFTFVRSGGPGGQNVNKVATAAQLRFDARGSSAIDDRMFLRLKEIAGRRMTNDGVIVLTASRFRTQAENREDASTRLVDMLREASRRPKFRVSTRPSRASKERRLTSKKVISNRKKSRGKVTRDD